MRQTNGRRDAALRCGLHLSQIRREFAPTLPYLREQPSPVRLTRDEQIRNSLAVCAPFKVMDGRAAVGKAAVERHWLRARIAPKTHMKKLALGQLISFGFRKKR